MKKLSLLRLLTGTAAGLALAACVHTVAYADPIVLAHRGAVTAPGIPEETKVAYSYAHRYGGPNVTLDADVRWTKDTADADTVGTMVLVHDETLDRTTNCTGKVTDREWTYIRDRCRTDIGKQPVRTLIQLLTYARSVGRPVTLEIKAPTITDAQARQFYQAVKASGVQVSMNAFAVSLPSLHRVKRLEAADPNFRMEYATNVPAAPWPTVAQVKAVGNWVGLPHAIDPALIRQYQAAGIKVGLGTARNDVDRERILAKHPDYLVDDNVRAYRTWLAAR